MKIEVPVRAPRWTRWCCLPLLIIWIAAQTLAAQGPVCDPGLHPYKASPYAYGPQGDRCEGVYVKEVGGTPLWIASLTSSFEPYDLASGKSLRLAWPGLGDSVRIRVRGIKPDLYYGMDARLASARSYNWPIRILSSLRIRQQDIGVLAWTRREVGGVMRNVVVPIRVTQSDESPSTGSWLVLFPGVKLKEVYLTLGPANDKGELLTDQLIRDHEPGNQVFYPAERPIRLPLPPLEPGLYYLEISGERPNGSPIPVAPILIDTSEP